MMRQAKALAVFLLLALVSASTLAPPAAEAKGMRKFGHTIAIAARLNADDHEGTPRQRMAQVQTVGKLMMDRLGQILEAQKQLDLIDQQEYDFRRKYYAQAGKELNKRIERMYFRRGVLNKAARTLEGVIDKATGEVRRGIKFVIRPLPGDRRLKEAIARLGASFLVERQMVVVRYRATSSAVSLASKGVNAQADFFNDLARKLKAQPRLANAEQCKSYMERCLKTCEEIRADCIRLNCKAPGYSGCAVDCGGCRGRTCTYAFDQNWCNLEPGFIGCASGLASGYLGKVSSCVKTFATTKGRSEDRIPPQTECLNKAATFFDNGFRDCMEQSCKAHCKGSKAEITPFNQCVCRHESEPE
jgi:hypothetical protein